MLKPKVKAVYKNSIAYLYISDKILLFNNYYQLVFIGRIQDGTIFDAVILLQNKYKQCEQSFTIYHGEDMPEVFYRVDTCTL